MPLNKDDPTYKEFDDRLKMLETGKISVKNLPITDLRRALQKEPQNPAELILPHSIGADLMKLEQAWQPLTLINSWVAYGGGWMTPRYKKLTNGLVLVRGLVKKVGATVPEAVGVLPPGYRPLENEMAPHVTVIGGLPQMSRGDCWLTGEVVVYTTTGGGVEYVEINHTFIAER